MEYAPLGVALLALLISLFFRTPKEASAEAREDAKQLRQDIISLWAAHNALAMEHATNTGRTSAQYAGHEKELGRLSNELSGLSTEIRKLSDLIRQQRNFGDR